MQNKLKIWRASNPIFLICTYLLIGVFCFKATKQYWPIIEQENILCIVIITLLLQFLFIQINKAQKGFNILPTLLLILWGLCIAQYNKAYGFFNVITSSEWVDCLRQHLMDKLDHSFLNKASNDFIKTLLFAAKSNMPLELKTAYKELGILHIIAISGMHLDILFKLLEKSTMWLPYTNWARWIKLLLLLIIVWTYTCVAHAGPSIVRASLFFSTVLVGRFFQLNLFSFNTISTGILLVLLYNSQIISSIGLQLSYAAVIGIHFFYKPIAALAPMDNKLLKIVWENLALSIAAQLTTVPLLLFYFHTSSSLSIIGNFLFVPASNLLLYSLLAFMVLPDFTGVTQWIAKGISLYIEKMNETINLLFHFFQIEKRSYDLDITGLAYYYFCLFVGYYWLKNKASKSLFMLLVGACIYSLLKLFSI